MARKHSEDEVLKSFRQKRDIKIVNDIIYLLQDKKWVKDKQGKATLQRNPSKFWDLGNGSHGKIDFLVNYCEYTIRKIPEFSRKYIN